MHVLTNDTHDHAMVKEGGPNSAIPLDKADNNRVMALPAKVLRATGFLRAGQLGFVCNYGLTGTAKRPDIATGSHGVADTMAKEPCGFHAAAEHALKLPGRNAFLTGAKQMNGLQPEPERQLGFLENGTHADSKGLAALVALAQTGAGGLALETANPRAIGIATVRANRAVRPKLGFDVLESSGFVMKAGV
jgi:hypothetical protein